MRVAEYSIELRGFIVRLQAVWTHCVKIGPERLPSQTSRPIRGVQLRQEP